MFGALALLATGCGNESSGPSTTTTPTTSTTSTILEPPTGTPTGINSVVVGQCFNHAPDSAQRDLVVLKTPCEATHRFEVYATLTLPADSPTPAPRSAPYPDETNVRTSAEQSCLGAFEPWMGTAWTASVFDFQAYWPSADGWINRTDRLVVCAAFSLDDDLRKGSARQAKL